MKKYCIVLLSVLMCFCMSGCGGSALSVPEGSKVIFATPDNMIGNLSEKQVADLNDMLKLAGKEQTVPTDDVDFNDMLFSFSYQAEGAEKSMGFIKRESSDGGYYFMADAADGSGLLLYSVNKDDAGKVLEFLKDIEVNGNTNLPD